ncbi:SDR family NAD(P)-dependent oxidoreductase [Microbacterium sp. JZ37]|uniref:SDR family NAD(P)-dependent oxidoreductase n=1 Tax=Microbacterium sp. JZ37 TaxID=2654193 RepID=UPI002B4914D6|nr:SDR family NAD(P)-dependent oxidoreductase [Microbacterium sp. JZ37]
MRRRIDSGTVVVVLGASSGIGRAAAHAFARHAARLVLCARTPASLEAAADECRSLGAADVLIFPLDVVDEDAVADMLASVERRLGRVDVWVAASSLYSLGTVESTPSEVTRRILEVNLIAQMEAARAAIPYLRRSRGAMILLGSVFSEVPAPFVGAYAASKHGIAGFAKVLRLELRGEVDVCLLLPATIDTPIHQHAANATGRAIRPLPPLVPAERVASAIVELAIRPRRRRVVGWTQGAAVYLRPLCPGLVDAFMSAYMRHVGVRRMAASPSEGNLFHVDPGSNAVSGGWRRSRAREEKRTARQAH